MPKDITTSRSKTVGFSVAAFGADRDPVTNLREWDYSADCMAPVTMHVSGKPDLILYELGIEGDKPYNGHMSVRCRKCEACLRWRSRVWSAKAIAECKCATRTWFCTLTLAPEHRVRFQYAANAAVNRRVGEWHELSEVERTLEIGKVLVPELTLFLKRVRKKESFRYLLVQEAHKDGFPHFHMLLHEHTGSVTKRELERAWRLGFSQFRLINEGETRHAFYVCKYLAKSALARIRASEGYGQKCKLLAAQRLIPLVDALRCNSVRVTPPVMEKEKGPGSPKGEEEIHCPF